MALACCCAIRTSVASMVTRPSPCLARKSEIIAAGEDSAAAWALESKAKASKRAKSDFMCAVFAIPGLKYHSFAADDNDHKALEPPARSARRPSVPHRER